MYQGKIDNRIVIVKRVRGRFGLNGYCMRSLFNKIISSFLQSYMTSDESTLTHPLTFTHDT